MEGLERIKVLASEIEDKDLLEIVNYLLTRTDMNEKYLNEEKSLKQMTQFINSEAKKEFEKKRTRGLDGCCVRNEVVFGWAIHYWDEPNEKLNLGKIIETKAIEKKEKIDSKENTKTTKKDWAPEGQLTLF